MLRSKDVFLGLILGLMGCTSGESDPARGEAEGKVSAYFPIPKGCREYTEEFFSKRLVNHETKFSVQEFRVKFDATSSVEAVGVLEGPSGVDDIRLARLILEVARGCYPNTYSVLDISDDADSFELGVGIKHSLGRPSNVSSVVLDGDKILVYFKNNSTADESLEKGTIEDAPM